VCIDEQKLLSDIERLIKREIPSVQVPGFEPDPAIKAEPIPNGRNQPRGGQRTGRGQPQGRGNAQPAHPKGPGGGKPALHRFGGRGR
jgi:ATP-dependent RNA helicase RhlE